jgi:hypothetical protein
MIHFFDADVGLCIGNPNGGNWEIYRTTDGGDTWDRLLNIPPPVGTEQTFFLGSSWGNNFWFSSSNPQLTIWGLYRTTDRGMTWTRRDPAGGPTFGFFHDSLNGIAGHCIPFRQLLRTSDGGDTWVEDPGGVPPLCGGLAYVPGTLQTYVVTGPTGWMYSNNAGTSWTVADTTLQYGFSSFSSPNAGWCAGEDGVVYKWIGDSLLTSVKHMNEIAQGFFLEQNYPNPFNPSTRIAFSVQRSGFTTLKVYDILGREVRTLVNETLQSGSHEVTFNAEGLSSGVYFYRLQAGEFAQTRRLLLLR